MTVPSITRRHGGVVHRSELLRRGVSPWQIEQSLAARELFRVRRAWYGVPDAPENVIRAVRVGGSLTAVSAAQHWGLWTIDDGRLHVSVARNASRLRSADNRRQRLSIGDTGICLHWRKTSGATTRTIEPAASVLIHALECQPEEYAIALIDSALQQGFVTRSSLEVAFSPLSPRYREALDKSDGRAQSGTESIVRLRLRALGIRVQPQVNCGGPRVDLLVGDRLVIECHSRAHHTGAEAYSRDRRRELVLVDGDYLSLTLTYEQVFFTWADVERVILGCIARGVHRWPRNSPRRRVP